MEGMARRFEQKKRRMLIQDLKSPLDLQANNVMNFRPRRG